MRASASPEHTGTRAGGIRLAASGRLLAAGTLLALAGVFNAVIGLVGLFRSGYYVTGPMGTLVFDITAWSWIHLGVGVFAAATGVALFLGAEWAKVVAVLLAGFNALAQLVFVAASPLWSIIVIALDVLIILAVLTPESESRTPA
ncbi:hypothetical protein BAY61_10130 [Prauserella marina]|uniref:DUF7144 domain-containing protein n=1 Tax=Prauserella marina TaxID=530584 RepID=A0A222VN40_9PSEU|nr:hypothetical protein [Prauserella marina]ASR35294.1 hypothetical protein BAY61_10130 [Prauserella marina]PWV84929.1 hypothetical protein DES30_101948 [Prauserella marina]SDC09146.1 hypothetical protein SAMN05421630_101389 [Prauserella marina]